LEETTHTTLAWRGRTPKLDTISVYMMEWHNPHPERAVEQIIIRSAPHQAPVVLAVTVAAKKPSAPAKP